MKKTLKKKIIIAIALAVLLVGFCIDRKNGMSGVGLYNQEPEKSPVVNKKQPLTIHNETGSKVNAAFYNKRFRRSGSVIRVEDDKLEVARRSQAPYLAVARNSTALGAHIEKSTPHTKVTRARCVKIASRGYDLMVTPTAKKNHKH